MRQTLPSIEEAHVREYLRSLTLEELIEEANTNIRAERGAMEELRRMPDDNEHYESSIEFQTVYRINAIHWLIGDELRKRPDYKESMLDRSKQ